MANPKIKPVRAVCQQDGTLAKPVIGELVEAYAVGDLLFETAEEAKAHVEHMELRDKLATTLLNILFDIDMLDEDTNFDLAVAMADTMLGVPERRDAERNQLISILSKDRQLYG